MRQHTQVLDPTKLHTKNVSSNAIETPPPKLSKPQTPPNIGAPKLNPNKPLLPFSTPDHKSSGNEHSPTALASSRKDARLESGSGWRAGMHSLRAGLLKRKTLDNADLVNLGKMSTKMNTEEDTNTMAETQGMSAKERMGKWKGKDVGGRKEETSTAAMDSQVGGENDDVDSEMTDI